MDEVETLRFDANSYEKKTCTLEGRTIVYRAWEGLPYCAAPVDPVQKLNLFVPECLYDGTGAYTPKTAPIFMPNTVGAYMPGPATEPGPDPYGEGPNNIFCALEHGYVVASVGVRGRTTGWMDRECFEGSMIDYRSDGTTSAVGRMVGRAPALITDYKAAIRWMRHNADTIPGCMERIITSGTSAGGELSALAGATGNVEEYEPYLAAIGAFDERDDIFAANCYCPVHNLENSDAAYEWLFSGHNDYHSTKYVHTLTGVFDRITEDGQMTPEQVELSRQLKELFPAYLNSLGLVDDKGKALTLDANGEGSFKSLVASCVMAAAQRELETHENERTRPWMLADGAQIDGQDYLTVANGKVVDMDWDGFVSKITRMKPAPAFDAVDLHSLENEEFGDEHVDSRHFAAFSMEHNKVAGAELADPDIVRLMNPIPWIAQQRADVAPHWRVRHGAFDRDTSLAIPVILATMLRDKGCDVDFFLPWGLRHGGDYDLSELFTWIDGLCKA